MYIILSLVPSYAEAFGRFKFDIASVYFLGRGKYTSQEVLPTLNLIALASSGLILAGVALNFEWLYQLLFSKAALDARSLLWAILPQVPLQFLWMNYSYLLLSKEDVPTYNRMVVLNALISSGGAAILLLLFDIGLWGVVGATLAGTMFSLIYAVVGLGVSTFAGPIVRLDLVKDLFSYGSKVYGGGLVGQLQGYLLSLLTAVFLATNQVAFFSMARNFSQMLERLPAALNTLLLPRLSQIEDQAESAVLAARAFRLMSLVLGGAAILAAVGIYPAIYILYGTDFVPAVLPFLVLLPGTILAAAVTPFMQYFLSIDRAALGITIPIPGLVVQLLLAVVLLEDYGALGAAFAFGTGLAILALTTGWMFSRVAGVGVRAHLLPQMADVRYLKDYSRTVIKGLV